MLEELEKALKSWPYPWPDYLELAQKVRDEAIEKAQTDRARDKALADYSDRLNRIFEWVQQNPSGRGRRLK
jgi:hypothetical protein